MAGAWHRTMSVYGPAFTLASEPIALITRSSATKAAWIFKVIGAAAVLSATALAGFLARRKAYAVAFVGWNPLLAVDFAGGGNNDTWMAALVLAALALAATGRRHLSAVAWAALVRPAQRDRTRGRSRDDDRRLHLASPQRRTRSGTSRPRRSLILIASPYLVSWYTIWAVPLAAAEEDEAAQLLSLGLCAYLLRQGIRT